MAVELKKLYEEIKHQYNVKLETESCFGKRISWLHILDNIEFATLLHGDELIFNSSLSDATPAERKQYIDQLLMSKAGGLIVSLQSNRSFSEDLIQYCNEKHLPLFTTGWNTPFINITRIFSEILIDNERMGMDLIAALKIALNHPDDYDSYLPHFKNHHFPLEDEYIISVIGNPNPENSNSTENMDFISQSIQAQIDHSVHYKDGNMLVLLTRGYKENAVYNLLAPISKRFPDIRFSIGSIETNLSNIHRSYHNAKQTFYLSNRIFPNTLICYRDIGVHQILMDMKNPEIIFPSFIQDTLGKLITYDKENNTNYMTVLKSYFANDCSITQTSAATYFHQNTLKYKVKNIKDILGYDITTNENRVKIILALYMLDLS